MDTKNYTSFVSVIIPAYNAQETIERTVLSIINQHCVSDLYEILIVDDGSTDKTYAIVSHLIPVRRVPIRCFRQPHKGPAAARNRGIQEARGKRLLFTDADCIAHEKWVFYMSCADMKENIAGVGGTIVAIPNPTYISQYCAYTHMNREPVYENNKLSFIITGNALFKKSALESVGGFDERFSCPGGEDPDICYRLLQRGHSFVYEPKSVVFNPHKKTVCAFARTYFYYGIGDSFITLKEKSSWDLKKEQPLPLVLWAYIKMIGKGIQLCTSLIVLFFRKLIMLPIAIARHYVHVDALTRAFFYAYYDCLKILSFDVGRFIGYIQGKQKKISKRNKEKKYI